MLQPGTGLGKAQSLQSKNVDVISRAREQRNDRDSPNVGAAACNVERIIMRHKLHLSAVIAVSLMTASSAAFAQASGAGGAQGGASSGVGSAAPPAATPTNPGSAGISSAPGGQSSTTTGMGTDRTSTTPNPSLYPSGAPNTSSGTSGTGLSPNGMPDEDATTPGSPGRMGR
jgi:hypothetical protein